MLVLLVVVAAAVFAVWLGRGLLSAARDVKLHANETQASLQAFKTSLQTGDQPGAVAHLADARTSLDQADLAADRRQVRIASHLPVASTAVADLDHLLAAADLVVDAGDRVQRIYADFSGKDSKLFRDNRFDLPALASATRSAHEIDAMMGTAETELQAVKGTVRGTGQVVEARDSALVQVKDLRAQIDGLLPILDVLPDAVGARGPKRYLIALLNAGEIRGTGGAPLSVAVAQFDQGRMTVVQRGATAQLTYKGYTENAVAPWTWTPNNPYRATQRFVNSNLNPDFPVSAEEMIRSWKASTKVSTDGVIAMDAVALREVLRATGPIESEDYGTVTADNFVKTVLVDPYTEFLNAENSDRRDLNNELIDAVIPRLTQGGGLVGKLRTIGSALPGRHLQLYFRDQQLQSYVQDKGIAGALAVRPAGDYAAAFTQNTNGSKVDVFQQRRLEVAADVHADGGADVVQTLSITNAVPPVTGKQPKDLRYGYRTRYAIEDVQIYEPAGATGVSVSGGGQERSIGVDAAGRSIVRRQRVIIKPRATKQIVMRYSLPAGTFGASGSLAYRLTAEPSNLLNTPTLSVSVTAPSGWKVAAQPGWTVAGRTAATTLPLDELQTVTAPIGH